MWRIEFFEITAQIGPVLLIAFILEQRMDRRPGPGVPAINAARMAGLVLTLAGEVLAMAVVAGVLDHSRSNGQLVAGMFVLGLVYLPIALGGAVRSTSATLGIFVAIWFVMLASCLVVLSILTAG